MKAIRLIIGDMVRPVAALLLISAVAFGCVSKTQSDPVIIESSLQTYNCPSGGFLPLIEPREASDVLQAVLDHKITKHQMLLTFIREMPNSVHQAYVFSLVCLGEPLEYYEVNHVVPNR